MKHHENNIEVLDPNSEFGQCCIDAEKFVHLRFDSFDYLGPHSQQALLIALDQLYAPGSVKIRLLLISVLKELIELVPWKVYPFVEFGQCCIDAEKFVHLRFDSFDYLGPHSQQALLIALDQLYAPGSVKIRYDF
ncbi:hypothetical protein WUBG_17895 [Wuchereria bancrofti]|uniref:Uncharacterized protein n=1 Tax=Wuchereria bancrofti TaxID=6293 RepID=J9E2M8_WUCBA|nr:hypothetical protein WUBG_17895 [Wuchereria bancrofti]